MGLGVVRPRCHRPYVDDAGLGTDASPQTRCNNVMLGRGLAFIRPIFHMPLVSLVRLEAGVAITTRYTLPGPVDRSQGERAFFYSIAVLTG